MNASRWVKNIKTKNEKFLKNVDTSFGELRTDLSSDYYRSD